jgi:hypothetical protein
LALKNCIWELRRTHFGKNTVRSPQQCLSDCASDSWQVHDRDCVINYLHTEQCLDHSKHFVSTFSWWTFMDLYGSVWKLLGLEGPVFHSFNICHKNRNMVFHGTYMIWPCLNLCGPALVYMDLHGPACTSFPNFPIDVTRSL